MVTIGSISEAKVVDDTIAFGCCVVLLATSAFESFDELIVEDMSAGGCDELVALSTLPTSILLIADSGISFFDSANTLVLSSVGPVDSTAGLVD